jgi:pimeloyl-ACP methyl ester carboxylesterase
MSMAFDEPDWRSSMVKIAGTGIHVRRRGAGRSLLVLHRDIGTPDRLPFYDALSRQFDVIIPDHPGFGKSERPSWIRSVRDTAVFYRWMLCELGVERPAMLGLGFGGWIAAEMATFDPASAAPLVLVGAMGLKPPRGDILDQALISYIDYVKSGFVKRETFQQVFGERPSSEQLIDWDVCREMCFRVAWRPYMYSDSLPYLLGGVRSPALIVWGDDDAVVPRSAGELYAEQLRNSRFETLGNAGHLLEMEHPGQLAEVVVPYLNQP